MTIRSMALAVFSVVAALGLSVLFVPGEYTSIAQALGFDKPHRLLPIVQPAVRSSDYTIMEWDYAGDPITYDPCQPLTYVINPAGAPADYLAFIAPAIRKAQAATGLEFVYDGLSSDTAPTREHATTSEPVLISFPASIDSTAAHADTIGLGGSTWAIVNGKKQPHYLTGNIQLLSSWFARESAAHATGAEESVVMHELGHVLGLGHVHERNEVMYPDAHGQTHYGVGDLNGLARLGSGQCG